MTSILWKKVGEQIHHYTQIVDGIDTNGFTVVMSCEEEIVGTASAKDWKAGAQENNWRPAGYYNGVSAGEVALMATGASIAESVTCDGDVEAFIGSVKPGQRYKERGIAEGLLRACEQQLKKERGAKTDQVRMILRAVRDINSQY